ncbi:MAG: exodeoxyribonuclease VII small subunit [Endomicrobium sp.]|jgi:exodeoxyribonuclease VII small subunit|nr:exodeoxyribonuclease VII small subunit [Endomicrobium sp.]
MTKKQPRLDFEKSLNRLEEIISEIENTSLDLDKALELFKEGNILVKMCSLKLDEAKKKVEIITSSGVEEFKE